MTNKTFIAVVAGYAALCTSVGASTFEDTTRDHKFSTEGNWSGGYPTAGVNAQIGPLATGTYTTDADMNTGDFVLQTGSTTPITIALGSHTWTASKWESRTANHAIIDGGTWVISGDATPGYSGNNSYICLTNGATLTASGRTNLGWSGNDNTLFLSGKGTKWIINATTQAHVGNSANNTRNLLYVNDGAYFSTKSNPFNVGQEGFGNTVRVESGAMAEFQGVVNIGRGNTDVSAYAGKGENKLVVVGGYVNMTNANSTLRLGGRPCAPSNRVEVTGNGCLDVRLAQIGAISGNAGGSSGSSYNAFYVADGGVVTGSVQISTSECEGYDPPHSNVFIVGTNGSFVARSSSYQTIVGQYGYGNGMLVTGAKEFDVSVSSTSIGDKASTNNWLKAVDTDRMKFANLYCGATGNGNRAEFQNVTNLVFSSLYCGQYSSNNTVTIMGTKSFTANDISLGRYCGSGNRMILGVAETLNIPANSITVGYGTKVEERGDIHGADDCHLKIVGCGDARLLLNPFDKVFSGSLGADCSCEFSNIETPEFSSGVTFPVPSSRGMSNFVFKISGGSVVRSSSSNASAGSLNVNGGNGFRAVLSGVGTTWTNGCVGSNNGYFNVGTTKANSHFVVEDGAEMFCGDSTAALGDAGYSSITIGNDATLDVYRIRMNGSNNALVISNGTLNVRNECLLPSTLLTSSTVVSNKVVFSGSHPRLRTENVQIALGAYARINDEHPARDTTLRFVLPAGGYAEPPIESESNKIMIAASTRMEADVSALGRDGGNFLLMRSGNSISVSDMTALSSTLPEKSRLSLKNGNKELWLRIPNSCGLVIVIK